MLKLARKYHNLEVPVTILLATLMHRMDLDFFTEFLDGAHRGVFPKGYEALEHALGCSICDARFRQGFAESANGFASWSHSVHLNGHHLG